LAIGAFPASLLFGLVWERFGAAAAFGMGAGLALLSSVMLATLRETRPRNAD